jgi:Ca2+-transporting ATPase
MKLPERAHALPTDEVLAQLQVTAAEGLTEDAARERRRRLGPNTVGSRRAAGSIRLLLRQFRSPVVYLLGMAAALAFHFEELEESGAIVAVLAINALIGFWTELKAARSIEALRALGGRSARVRRERHVRLVPAEDLVPGDIVLVDAGDAVSADLRLLEASGLAADESALTGESVAVEKETRPIAPDSRLGERSSMLLKGTAVTRGSGSGVVVATGLATELGRVTQLVLQADPGTSPLARKLGRLTGQIAWATVALAAAIAGLGLGAGRDPFLMVEAAIALAVAAIPEGLPVVATLTLARGMWRMARQNALIERLSAVETLGATTIILTDKTGTLTENRMTVRRLAVPSGEIETDSTPDVEGDRLAMLLLRIGVLCNDAHLDRVDAAGSGDPMEVALLRAGLRTRLKRPALLRGHRIVRKHAFDSATRMMATVHESGDGYLVAVKGAPEQVITAASRAIDDHGEVALRDDGRAEWLARAEQLGHHGLRVLACAMKMDTRADGPPYEGLVLVGLIGLADPARADVPQAIEDCRRAGIRVVMVTGDHAVTARSIGRAVGIADRDTPVVDGKAIERAITAGPARLRETAIFARVSPAEKLALVKAYQEIGDVVAMTGDGVNDAPALRQADIGVAMGLRGTDVAREAAAMILLDDAFPTIVKAIREGRVIFDNIRRFIAYLLACNLSEVAVVGLAVASGLPLPLLPLQILYLNLITDVFPAFALAMGNGEDGILGRPPRDPKEPILGRAQWLRVVTHATALTAGTFAALAAAAWLGLDSRQSVTVTFLTLGFAQLWHVFNMRSPNASILFNEVTRNGWLWASLALCTLLLAAAPYVPPLAHLLHLEAPTAAMWAVVLVSSLAPLVAIQGAMSVHRHARTR